MEAYLKTRHIVLASHLSLPVGMTLQVNSHVLYKIRNLYSDMLFLHCVKTFNITIYDTLNTSIKYTFFENVDDKLLLYEQKQIEQITKLLINKFANLNGKPHVFLSKCENLIFPNTFSI